MNRLVREDEESKEFERVFKKCFADVSGEIVCTVEPFLLERHPEWKSGKSGMKLTDVLNDYLSTFLYNKVVLLNLRKKLADEHGIFLGKLYPAVSRMPIHIVDEVRPAEGVYV